MLVYLCGPHGAGKSTLAEKMTSIYPAVQRYPEDTLDCLPKIQDDCYLRVKTKLLKCYLERVEQKMSDNAQNITLCNRCEYDSLVYGRAFVRLGWISAGEYQHIEKLAQQLLDGERLTSIILNPSLETLETQLQQRWSKGIRKWREENREYLAAVHEEYQKFAGEHKILYLTDETLEEKVFAIGNLAGLPAYVNAPATNNGNTIVASQ